MTKRRKTTTKKGREVLGTRAAIQPIMACNPWGQRLLILQLQSELKSQEARILGLQNGFQLERIAQLEATIQRKDDEIKKKDEQLEATIQRKDDEIKKKDGQFSELVGLQTKGEVTIKEMQALQAKDEVTTLDLEVKLTILEAELAESKEDLAKHKVIMLNLATSIFTSLRTNAKPK
jgi:chromosome segregation ATPase